MDELIAIRNDRPVVDSKQVAKNFHKDHKHVLDAIRNLVAQNSATKKMFYETEFTYRGQKFPKYLMDRDGFTLLVMGFTGKKAIEWKLKYIAAFNKMEKQIVQVQLEKASPIWIESRHVGMAIRGSLEETINDFIKYCYEHESQHAGRYFVSITNIANKAVGLKPKSRNIATTMQLNQLAVIENLIRIVIRAGIDEGKEYHRIFGDCKAKVKQYLEVSMIQTNPLLLGGIA